MESHQIHPELLKHRVRLLVVGCFDDEAQTAMEITPQPNVIIPLKLCDPASVRKGFRTLGVVCEALASASRLIDLMPGNDEGVITREG